MDVAEVVGLVLVLLAAALLAVAGRRRLLQRQGGALDVALRLRPQARGGGWVLGVGRFVDDDLRWYRVFSLSPRPRRTLSRRGLQVLERRRPVDGETFALAESAVVMRCGTDGGQVELGIDASAVTGFLAWLEASPPGATLPSI